MIIVKYSKAYKSFYDVARITQKNSAARSEKLEIPLGWMSATRLKNLSKTCNMVTNTAALSNLHFIIIIIKNVYIAQVHKGHKCAVGRDGSMFT